VVATDDYFPFARAGKPVIQQKGKETNALLLQLTATAKEELQQFTARHLSRKMVVIVDNKALAVYTTDKPVNSGLIIVTKCGRLACRQIFEKLNQL